MAKSSKAGRPRMYDTGLLLAAGIDRAILNNALIAKGSRRRTNTLEEFKKALRVLDEQDAVNRYVWHNVPGGITSQELERMLYYRGQLCIFYWDKLDKFYFMPYALDGTIDFYGRYNRVHPIPFFEGKGEEKNQIREILSTIKLEPLYDVLDDETKDKNSLCVILHDYTRQKGQELVPRQFLQDPIIAFEAESFPMARTAMIASSGIKGLRVQDADQKEEVEDANDQVYSAALTGALFIPMAAPTEMQEISDKSSTKAEDYLMQMQAIDNFRLSLLGIDNGGLFQKKAHKLQDEQDMNQSPASLAYEDGLAIRQNFCNIVNSIWPIGIWCDRPDYMKKMDDQTPEEEPRKDNPPSNEGGRDNA